MLFLTPEARKKDQ